MTIASADPRYSVTALWASQTTPIVEKLTM
jgi:hypothetical protein